MNRISIREKTFNGIPTEEPLTKIPVVIIGVAFVSRIYYKDAYSSEKVAKPTCWSENQETVYQLHLPPTSIFGETIGGDMPLRAYARYLEARETPFVALVTDIYFDDESNTPKLFFRPVRPLEEQELETVKKMLDHEDTTQALTLNVVSVEDRSSSPFAVMDGFTIKNNLENV